MSTENTCKAYYFNINHIEPIFDCPFPNGCLKDISSFGKGTKSGKCARDEHYSPQPENQLVEVNQSTSSSST